MVDDGDGDGVSHAVIGTRCSASLERRDASGSTATSPPSWSGHWALRSTSTSRSSRTTTTGPASADAPRWYRRAAEGGGRPRCRRPSDLAERGLELLDDAEVPDRAAALRPADRPRRRPPPRRPRDARRLPPGGRRRRSSSATTSASPAPCLSLSIRSTRRRRRAHRLPRRRPGPPHRPGPGGSVARRRRTRLVRQRWCPRRTPTNNAGQLLDVVDHLDHVDPCRARSRCSAHARSRASSRPRDAVPITERFTPNAAASTVTAFPSSSDSRRCGCTSAIAIRRTTSSTSPPAIPAVASGPSTARSGSARSCDTSSTAGGRTPRPRPSSSPRPGRRPDDPARLRGADRAGADARAAMRPRTYRATQRDGRRPARHPAAPGPARGGRRRGRTRR